MNVRCVGRSTVGEPTPGNRTITKTPCGWTGERAGKPTKVNGEIHWNILTFPDDPCPQCGARVQFIPEVER